MKNLKAGEISYSAPHQALDPEQPTLVFIHGAGMNRHFWDDQVKSLGDEFNTVAIDLPGHGNTQLPGERDIKAYAASVRQLIDRIEAPRPVPCGLSMGGAIVQQLLIEHGGTFAAGVMINTGARLKVMPMIFETIEKNYSDFVEMLCAFAVSPKSDKEKIRSQIEAATRCDPQVAIGDFEACNNFDVMALLDRVEVPVLVLTAGDDNLTPMKYGAFLAEKIKTAALANIEDAGHLSPLEKPEAVNQTIRTFLKNYLA